MTKRTVEQDLQDFTQDESTEPRPPKWLVPVRNKVLVLPGGLLVWRAMVAVVGLAIVAGGLLLIPLPGPGWVIVFFGLAVWATEFVWAQRLLRKARAILAGCSSWIKRQSKPVQALLGVAGLLVLLALAYLVWKYIL